MSPENVGKKRLPKSTRVRVRALKAEERREIGLPQFQKDSQSKDRFEEFLRLRLGPAYGEFAPHFSIFNEFRLLREEIKITGYNKKLLDEFQDKHGKEKLSDLARVLRLVIEYVGK